MFIHTWPLRPMACVGAVCAMVAMPPAAIAADAGAANRPAPLNASAGSPPTICDVDVRVSTHLKKMLRKAILNDRDFSFAISHVTSRRQLLSVNGAESIKENGCRHVMFGTMHARNIYGEMGRYNIRAEINFVPQSGAANVVDFDLYRSTTHAQLPPPGGG